ncbi:molybdenum cofactor biosynthesis protein B [Candidatus Omnitrophota bacterium]
MSKFAVLTISDRCSRGESEDKSGKIIIDILKDAGWENASYDIVADEIDLIQEKLLYYCDNMNLDLMLTTGGTGLGPRDVTPEATLEVCEKIIPGISEFIRSEGSKKTRNAILSRGISALRKNTIIINLPGSPKGAQESLTVILDLIPHALEMVRGKGHDNIPHE